MARKTGAPDDPAAARSAPPLPVGSAQTLPGESAKALAGDPATTLGDRRRSELVALPIVESDRYEILSEVGRGGLGRVMEARDPRLERTVALKELVEHDADARARFLREAVVTARLEHPSIVPIHEAGRWPSGEPFYVMKLVSGRSLDAAAAAAGTLAGRTALLPNVVAVAEAVAYAHSQGVIHRDLKPQNVLVGAFGETVVIDWGLAKYLDSAEDPISSRRRSPSTGEMTELGTVIGTPAYMPPEQASGKRVDERADVYALGAILYHVFAGKPPYSAHSSAEVLEAVAREAPPPLASLVPDLPDDLIAIVEKAMARDPAARYPTARELAQDLRRFEAGQLVASHRYSPGELVRRWLRRYRAPIAVAVVALVVLVAASTAGIARIIAERRSAEDQRALAQKRSTDVEDLMGFMLFDLRDKLMNLGRLDLIAPVARRAADYYRESSPNDDDQIRHRRAVALLNIGDVMRSQADATGALADYLAARGVAAEMAARDPLNSDAQLDLAQAHKRVGQIFMVQDQATNALTEFNAAVDILERNRAREPQNPVWLEHLIEAHVDRGNAYMSQAKLEPSVAEYATAIDLGDEVIARFGATTKRVQALVIAHHSAGGARAAHGDLDAGVAELRIALMTAIAARTKPPTLELEIEVYSQYLSLGQTLANQAVTDGALAELATARAVIVELMATDRSGTELPRDLSRVDELVGGVLLERGDLAGAETSFRTGLAIVEHLGEIDPTNAEWQYGIFDCRSKLARVYERRGDWKKALEEYRVVQGIAERRAGIDPTQGEWASHLIGAHQSAGTAYGELHEWDHALDEYRAAEVIAERSIASDPGDGDAKRSLIAICNAMAEIMVSKGDPTSAVGILQRALVVAEELAGQDPASRDNQVAVNELRGSLAEAYGGLHHWDDALVEARGSMDGTAKLVALDPTNADWQEDLVAAHDQVAGLLGSKGDRAGARHELAVAIDLAEVAVRRDPANHSRAKTLDRLKDELRKLR